MKKIINELILKKNDLLLLFFILIYTLYALFPLLNTGYFADDVLNVTANADAELLGMNILQLSWHIWFDRWFLELGRIFPFAFYAYTVFAVVKSLLLYKIITLIVVFLDILAFGYLVRLLFGSKHFSYLLMLTVVSFFQFRIAHDPILAFHFMLPLVLLEILVSLIFFKKYLLDNKKRSLILSAVLYLIALLTYEITYVLCALHFIVALAQPLEQQFKRTVSTVLITSIKRSWVFLALSLLMITLSIYFRASIPFEKGNPYALDFEPLVYCITVLIQTAGSIPLLYFFNNKHFFSFKEVVAHLDFADIIITCLYGYLLFSISKTIPRLKNLWALGLFGFTLMVFPAIMISTSAKHQATPIGTSYLQVYLEYFGAISIFAFFIVLLNRHFISKRTLITQKIIAIGFISIVSSISLLNILCNRLVAEQMNLYGYRQMAIIECALTNGLIDDIPEGATILTDSESAWDRREYYFWLLGKKYEIVSTASYMKTLAKNLSDSTNTKENQNKVVAQHFQDKAIYILKYYNYTDKKRGVALFGRINEVIISPLLDKAPIINVSQCKAFVVGDIFYTTVNAKTNSIQKNGAVQFSDFSSLLTVLPVKKSTHDWVLYTIPSFSDNLDFNSIYFSSQEAAQSKIASAYKSSIVENYFSNALPTTLQLIPSIEPTIHSLRINKFGYIFDYSKQKYTTSNYQKVVNGLNGFAVEMGASEEIIVLDTVSFRKDLTIEMIINPHKEQVQNALLIGNHPGTKNYQGFVVQQDGSNDRNSYTLGYGDGKRWISPNIKFSLSPHKWHYLVIEFDIVKHNKIMVFDNGIKISEDSMAQSTLEDSDMPIMVANWFLMNRPFRGIIEEITISNYLKPSSDITKTAHSLGDKIDLGDK